MIASDPSTSEGHRERAEEEHERPRERRRHPANAERPRERQARREHDRGGSEQPEVEQDVAHLPASKALTSPDASQSAASR